MAKERIRTNLDVSPNPYTPIPGTIFYKDFLPDGCTVYAVMIDKKIQDLYRADKSRLLLRAPCGAVTHTYTTHASGDHITTNGGSDGSAIFTYDGNVGLIGKIIQ